MIKRGGRSNESCSEVPRVGSSAVMYDGTRREKWKLPRVTLKPTDTERKKERERKKENLWFVKDKGNKRDAFRDANGIRISLAKSPLQLACRGMARDSR